MGPRISPIDGKIGELLQRTSATEFRTGFISVDGVCLPEYYKKFAEQLENFEVRDDDVWVCSFPKTGEWSCSLPVMKKQAPTCHMTMYFFLFVSYWSVAN